MRVVLESRLGLEVIEDVNFLTDEPTLAKHGWKDRFNWIDTRVEVFALLHFKSNLRNINASESASRASCYILQILTLREYLALSYPQPWWSPNDKKHVNSQWGSCT